MLAVGGVPPVPARAAAEHLRRHGVGAEADQQAGDGPRVAGGPEEGVDPGPGNGGEEVAQVEADDQPLTGV
ncbi:MAG TPA: hypothetical protein VIL46_17980, partial [Gemmataceae bacterium]